MPLVSQLTDEDLTRRRAPQLDSSDRLWVPGEGTFQLDPVQAEAVRKDAWAAISKLFGIPIEACREWAASPDGAVRCEARTRNGRACRAVVAYGWPRGPREWAFTRDRLCYAHGGPTSEEIAAADRAARDACAKREHEARRRVVEAEREREYDRRRAAKRPTLNGRRLHVPHAGDFTLSSAEAERFGVNPISVTAAALSVTEAGWKAWLVDPNVGINFCAGTTKEGRRCRAQLAGPYSTDPRIWIERDGGLCTIHERMASRQSG